MRATSLWLFIAFVLAALGGGGAAPAAVSSPPDGMTPAALPLSFAENHGQAAPGVRFAAQRGGLAVGIAPDRVKLRLGGPQVTLRLLNADAAASVRGLDRLPGVLNAYRGSDPARWRPGLPTYARVRCEDVYPGIDVDYYSRSGKLEYDLTVAPHADPQRILLRLEGLSKPRVASNGDLVGDAAGREVRWRRPVAYQTLGSERRPVVSRYALAKDGSVSFRLGGYDRARALVIDPVLEYSASATGELVLDAANNPILRGTDSVTKLNSTASAILFQTQIVGGDGLGPGFESLALDGSGNICLAGSTASNSLPGALNASSGGRDACVALLDGGGALQFTRYFGGSAEDLGHRVAVDAGGDLWVAGRTRSADIPLINPLQGYNPGEPGVTGSFLDGFVARISPDGQQLRFSTCLGGDRWDVVQGLRLAAGTADPARVYVAGRTESTDFPLLSWIYPNVPPPPGSGDPRWEGGDTFVACIEVPAAGPAGLVWSTTLGGEGHDQAQDLELGNDGKLYVAGRCSGAFPHTELPTDAGDLYILSMEDLGTAPALGYSRLVGGSSNDDLGGLAVDAAGRVCIAGSTLSQDLPLKDAMDSENNRPQGLVVRDGFVRVLEPNGDTLFSTYLGGDGNDGAGSPAFDSQSNVYVTGSSDYRYKFQKPSTFPFPYTSGTLSGNGTQWLLKISLRPAPAAGVVATALSSSQIALSWSNPTSNQDDVRVERATGSGAFAEVAVLSGSETSFTDSGLAARTTYRYRLRSSNEFGTSPHSAVAGTTTKR